MNTYTDLTLYWQCPRRWGYHKQGWREVMTNPVVLRGSYVHLALHTHWTGGDPAVAVAKAVLDLQSTLTTMRMEWPEKRTLQSIAAEALDLTGRYLNHLGQELHVRLSEHNLVVGDVGGHPDAIADYQEKLCLIELKTSDYLNLRGLDHTGQADYYAWLWWMQTGSHVALLLLDIISPEYITRLVRPPRLDKGAYMGLSIGKLTSWEGKLDTVMEQPRYGFWCNRCPFLKACNIRDAGGDDQEVLMQDFLRE